MHGEDQLQRHLRRAVHCGQTQCLLRRRVHAVSHIDRTRPGTRQLLCLDPAAAGRQRQSQQGRQQGGNNSFHSTPPI